MWQKEQVIHELQKSGRRVTTKREIPLEIILDGPWSCCKELYCEAIGAQPADAQAIKKDPSIGLATVYRMVGTLEEIGVLTRSYRYCLPAREPESGQLGA